MRKHFNSELTNSCLGPLSREEKLHRASAVELVTGVAYSPDDCLRPENWEGWLFSSVTSFPAVMPHHPV